MAAATEHTSQRSDFCQNPNSKSELLLTEKQKCIWLRFQAFVKLGPWWAAAVMDGGRGHKTSLQLRSDPATPPVNVALKPLPTPLNENTAVISPLLPKDSSGTKISFQLCVWIQVSRELKILEKKTKMSALTTILGMSESHMRTQRGKSLSCRLTFSATTQSMTMLATTRWA